MIKVLFITSGQPSLNPRLVKEADALATAGYDVTVVYAYWNDWGNQFTQTLLPTKKWKAINAGGHPTESPLVYFISRLIYKLAKWLFIKFPSDFFAELTIARSAWFLTREAKKHRADLYIGHNLGALPATVKTSRKYNAKCGFDAEDFHRQEVSDDVNSFNYKVAECIEDKYFPKLDYLTASSPQIADAYQEIYPDKKPVVILNVFPKSPIPLKIQSDKESIKLFWFSQTIGTNRGIEAVIEALNTLNSNFFELHLLGYCTEESKRYFSNLSLNNIYFHPPLPPDDIVDFASQFNIGLALEPGFSLNNKLALSNKIFTYLQAGLAIIASDTAAQKYFINKHPEVGKAYEKDNIQLLVAILSTYQSNRELLNQACKAALKLGHETLNWENESAKFLSVINATLDTVE